MIAARLQIQPLVGHEEVLQRFAELHLLELVNDDRFILADRPFDLPEDMRRAVRTLRQQKQHHVRIVYAVDDLLGVFVAGSDVPRGYKALMPLRLKDHAYTFCDPGILR